MTAYADHDAELIAEGIRLGGKSAALDEALATARDPLAVGRLEGIARPDLSGHAVERFDGFEHVGMCKISDTQHGYVVAAEWFGWLPGTYSTRDAALTAYGYVLGGEAHGYLNDIAKQLGGSVTVEDFQALAAE